MKTSLKRNAPEAQPPLTSWRDVLPIHPAAELFPRMSEEEINALAKDIKQNTLRQRVTLWTPGKPGDGENMSVLDGLNRLDALERNGTKFMTDDGRPDLNGRYFTCLYERRIVKTKTGVRKGDEPDVDPWDYVISANIQRRHLSAKDKRDLIAKVLKAKPEQSDRQIAKQVKAADKTVASVRRKLEANAEIPHKPDRIENDGRKARGRKPGAKPKPKPASSVTAGTKTNGPGGTTAVAVEAGGDVSNDSPNRHVVVPEGKPRGGVQTKDDTLLWFTTTICELLRKTDRQKPERFAATAVGADGLAKLGAFLNDIAKLKAARAGSTEISAEEMSAKFAALDAAQAK
jgi:hypothetical protein